MPSIKLKAPLKIGVGMVIGFSDKQAEARSFLIKNISKGKYEVLKPFDMKIGEEIFIDDLSSIPKTFWPVVTKPVKSATKKVADSAN